MVTIKVVKIGIRIVGSFDPMILHIEKEPDRGRIVHPNRISSRIGRIVRSYDPTLIPLNMLFRSIYIMG